MSMPRIFAETARLRLRRFQAKDLKPFLSYRDDAETALYQGWSAMDEDQAKGFIAEMESIQVGQTGEWIQIAVADIDHDRLLGDVAVCIDARKAEIGYTLAPESRGKGCAAEAVNALAIWIFENFDIEEIVAITDARNSPSIRVLERTGFLLAHEQDAIFKGEPCRERIYLRRKNGGA